MRTHQCIPGTKQLYDLGIQISGELHLRTWYKYTIVKNHVFYAIHYSSSRRCQSSIPIVPVEHIATPLLRGYRVLIRRPRNEVETATALNGPLVLMFEVDVALERGLEGYTISLVHLALSFDANKCAGRVGIRVRRM